MGACPAGRGAGLRLPVDGRPRVLSRADLRVAHLARLLRERDPADPPRHRRLPPRPAASHHRRQDHLHPRCALGRPARLRGGGGRRESEGVRGLRHPAPRARRARDRGHRGGAHALARHARDLQGSLHLVRGREPRSQARAEARAADLDRRALGRRARPRGPAGRRLGLLRGPARALQGEPREDPRRRRARPAARSTASSPRTWPSSRWGATTRRPSAPGWSG